ncbi:BspA family leucine-rich repeat surface protein [Blautia faecicola]|uniref:BspA family leucine-rich repeat surface protein n=1 Tax=Blautia faecicola TaxID=2509240 RepID=UPI003FD8F238
MKKIWKKLLAGILCSTLLLGQGSGLVYAEENVQENTEEHTEEESEENTEEYTEEDIAENTEEIVEDPEINETAESDVYADIAETSGTKILYSGVSGDLDWKIDSNGKLTISGSGDYVCDYDYYYVKTPMWCKYSTDITEVDLKNLDTSSMTSMKSMFERCSYIKTLDLSNFDTSNVTTMERMFYCCESLEQLDLSDFDTSNVVDMGEMFFRCTTLERLDVSNFDVAKVSNMEEMFWNCESLEKLDLSSFKTSKVTNTSSMFGRCLGLKQLDLSNFNTPDVVNMGSMFVLCEELKQLNLNNFDTSNVTDMSWAFCGCSKLSSDITVSGNVKEYENCFGACSTELNTQFRVRYNKNCSKELAQKIVDTKSSDSNVVLVEGGTGEDGSDEEDNGEICFFSKWDAEKQIAYFGDMDFTGSQVTEETDTSFLADVDSMVGNYVTVLRKSRTDNLVAPSTLLTISPVETKSGTVTAATTDSVTVWDNTYKTTLFQPKSYVGTFVLYHIRKDGSASVQKLEKSKGTLTSWNTETKRLKIGDEYKLGTGAEQAALDFLGQTKYTSMVVQFMHDEFKNIYRITDKLDADSDTTGPNFYDTAVPPTEDETILRDEMKEWDRAYEQYISSVQVALRNYAMTDEEKKNTSITEEARRMQTADKNSNSKYLTGALGSYAEYCYKALAEYLYDHTCDNIDFSSVDLSSTFAGTNLVKAVCRSFNGDERTYEYGDVKVTLNVLIVNSSKTGHLIVEKNGRKVVTAIVCSNQEEIQKSVDAYVKELRSLATNTVYNMSSAVYKDILGQSLDTLTEEYVSKHVTMIEKRFMVKLSEKFNSAGVGDVVKTLNECYSYYKYVEKNLNWGKLDDIQTVLTNIQNLEFKNTNIKDIAVKKSVKALQKAKKSFVKSYERHLAGTLSGNKTSFFSIHIKCPVDVEVYNSGGTRIGCANETDLWYDDSIIITDLGGAKTITSLTNDLITFKVSGRENGTMDCMIEEYNENHEPIGRLNYYNISLTPNQEYDFSLINDLAANKERLTINTNDEAIVADEYISSQDSARALISCNVTADDGKEGGTVTGVGTYIRGNAVVLSATPDKGYIFEGWYQEDELVSLNKTYEFTAKKDEVLTAKFIRDERVNVEINAEEGGDVTGSGRYYKEESVTVKAIPDKAYQFDGWYVNDKKVSDETEYQFTATEDITLTAKFKKSGKWMQSGSRWWYRYEDGSYPADELCKIGNAWYGFDSAGWMQNGWVVHNNKWYYFAQSGAMATEWIYVGGTWYYLNADGSMATGWNSIKGKWYYMNRSGAMVTGWNSIGGRWYYLNGSGAMVTDWNAIRGKWYYMNSEGAMQIGWVEVSGKWYYLNASGAMQTGWIKVNGFWYYMDANGVMQTNRWISSTYYVKADGRMAVSEWIQGYYVGADGAWRR